MEVLAPCSVPSIPLGFTALPQSMVPIARGPLFLHFLGGNEFRLRQGPAVRDLGRGCAAGLLPQACP